MATASPTDPRSTHHVLLGAAGSTAALVLCDSRGNASEYAIRKDPMPRMSLKMYSGEPKWDDLEPPWTPVAMSEWTGGRGRKEYDIDKTRYNDGIGVDTTKSGQIVLAGQPVYITNASQNKLWPYCNTTGGDVDYYTINLDSSWPYFAQKFTASSTFDPKHIHLILKYLENDTGGNSVGTLTITIRDDDSGNPGNLVANGTTTVTKTGFSEQDHWEDVYATFATAPSLTSGTDYWIRLDGSASDVDCWWSVLGGETGASILSKKSVAGVSWFEGDTNAFYRLRSVRTKARDFLFEYKDQVYWLRNVVGGTNLYYLGDHGLATSGTTTALTDSTKSWATNEFAGCIVRLVAGTGSTQRQNWAQIASNTSTALTFAPALDLAPAASTEYVIVASNKYTLIGNHTVTGLTAAATTDILPANGFIYFAQGDAVNIRRAEFYDNAGTWTRRYDDETAAGTFLMDGGDSTGTYIMRALRSNAQIDRASAVVAWGDLTWAGAVQIGSYRKRITGLRLYEDGDLWVLKEDSVWRVISGDGYWVPISAMSNVCDERNGAASIMHQVYLFFSLHNTILRYYDGNLDEIGIDMDDGLPANRKGQVSCFASSPNGLYAAVNGGANNYSAVFLWNGLGWCEVYRAFATGLEIDSILLQSIPGEHVDRLWIACGDDILWIPVSADPFRHSTSITYNFYPFKWGGMIETGWCYVGMKDVDKYWHSLKVFNENYTSGQTISGRYARTDYVPLYPTTGGWTTGGWLHGKGTVLDPSDYFDDVEKECDINPAGTYTAGGVSDEGLAFRLVMRTNSNQLTPRITAMVVDTAIRVPVKNIYSIVFRVKENDVDLWGSVDTQTAATKLANLTAAEGSSTPIVVFSTSTLLDGKKVFLDSLTMRPYYDTPDESGHIEGFICQAQLIEV